jgi:DNA polymerase zeta
MLKEILDTRVMIKQSMKLYTKEDDKVLRRVLDARQLALKMLANVTYGYAGAGYSGVFTPETIHFHHFYQVECLWLN